MAVHYEVPAGESLVIRGPANIIVKTGDVPLIGSGEDAAASRPEIAGLAPETAESGPADFTLTVTGQNFSEESVLVFAGQDEPTTFDGDTLSTIVKPSLFAPDIVEVEIRNGTLTSAPVDFTFTEPALEGQTSKKRQK